MENDIREVVSSTTYRKDNTQVRHLARINVKAKTFDNLSTTVAATKCGRWIHWPNDVTGVGETYTDGSVYTVKCPICFGK